MIGRSTLKLASPGLFGKAERRPPFVTPAACAIKRDGTPKLAGLVVIKTHLSRGFRSHAWKTKTLKTKTLVGHRIRRRPSFRDQPQKIAKDLSVKRLGR
jgi:hypothetical protein